MSTATNNAFDQVLAGLVSSYQKPEPKVRAPKAVKAPKIKVEPVITPVIPAVNGDEEQVVITNLVPALILPEVGTLGAKEFQIALRNAGRRVDNLGKPFTNQDEIRNDQIKAIAGYCGYDSFKDFGSQDLAARSKAIRELRAEGPVTGPSLAEVRRARCTIGGYVAGMPDTTASALANLQARERLAVSNLLENDAKAGSLNGSRYYGAEVLPRVKGEIELPALENALPTEKARGEAVVHAQLERERLAEIRRDLATLGK